MMEKLSIQEIAAVLVEKNGLRKKDAELFAQSMFDLIKECLASDRVVKVKGLGTFKVVDIEARESVNVNTGERVLIEGHDKITFTPDNTMKELVNKPFSQFETVVLNEGVTFEDIEEEPEVFEVQEVHGAQEPESELLTLTEKTEQKLEQESESKPKPEPEPESESEPEPELEVEQESEPEPKPTEEPESEEEIIEEKPEEELYMSKKMTYIALVIAILACILSFVAGYYFRGDMVQTTGQDSIAIDSLPTVATGPLVTDSLPVDSVKNDTVATGQPKVEPVAKTSVSVKEQPKTESAPKEDAKAAVPEVTPDKYEQMDARVRTGAYRIVGEDSKVKVKAGETLAKIARRTLGPDMECYLEVFNGLKSSAELKEGQTIKIPKLELKKKKKANN